MYKKLLALGLVSVALSCGDGTEPALVAEELLNLRTDQVVIGLEHYVTTDGVRRAHLLSDTAFFVEDSSSVDLRGVEVTFFNGLGVVTSTLTSLEGTYDWDTGNMVAIGNVVVVEPDLGRRVETSVMHYDRQRNRIWSDAPTTVYEADGTVIEGTAFESDASLDDVDLTSARISRRARPDPER